MIEMKPALPTLALAAMLATTGCGLFGFGSVKNDSQTAGARPTGFVYSTLYAKNKVLEINVVQSRVDNDPIDVPNGPRGLTLDPRGRSLYLYAVCELGNTVAVIDRRNRIVNRTINVGNKPYAMAITPTGTRGFVTNQDDDTVTVIDIPTNQVLGTILLQNPQTNAGGAGTTPTQAAKLKPRGIATNAKGDLVFVACAGGSVAVLQGNPGTATGETGGAQQGGIGGGGQISMGYTWQRTIPLIGSVAPTNIAVGSRDTTDTVYVTDPQANRVFFFNGAQANQAEFRDINGSPTDVAVGKNAQGNPERVYVTLENRNALQILDAANVSPVGDAVRCEGNQPTAVEVSSLGNEVFVALSGSNNIAYFEKLTGGALGFPSVFNLQQLNPSFISPTGDLALGPFLFQ